VSFIVAGFDANEAYGRIYEISVPDKLEPVEQFSGANFGVRWGGQYDFVNRLINGFDPRAINIAKDNLNLTDEQAKELDQKLSSQLALPIPWQFLPLQDYVDLASFLVTMTAVTQTWTQTGIRGVGGSTDVATITRNQGFQPIKHKQIEVKNWL
jgi:hypothetical protein